MEIGAAYHSEFVWVHSKLLTQHKAVLEGFAGIFPLEHLGLLELGAIKIGPVPQFVTGEFVVRRKHGMCFAVALNLGDLYEPFKMCAQGGDFLGERFSGECFDSEHPAVAEIAVVRNGQHLCTSLLLELGEMLPEVLGIFAVKLGIRIVRLATLESPRKITFRWRLYPPIAVHSKPMRAVNRPGSLYLSASAV